MNGYDIITLVEPSLPTHFQWIFGRTLKAVIYLNSFIVALYPSLPRLLFNSILELTNTCWFVCVWSVQRLVRVFFNFLSISRKCNAIQDHTQG
jgi:hypothetical protein